jgi:hypothetical protein
LAVGNNEFYWRVEQRATSGNGAAATDNKLVFMQKFGTNAWVDRVEFNKSGIVAPISGNTITLGAVGANGTLLLRRSSDGGGSGQVSASSSGGVSITGNNIILGANTGENISFSGNPSFGMRYRTTQGLYLTVTGNAAADPVSRLVVDGGASIGANVAAPANGLRVAGESIFTSTRTAYTATGVDLTLSASHSVVALTATGLTATLPTAVGITGRTYTIKLTASGTGTVATTSSQTIDGSTTYSLILQYKYVTVQSDGANWNIIGNN